jgi:hydrogenase small subunit
MTNVLTDRTHFDPESVFSPNSVRSRLIVAPTSSAGMALGPMDKIYLIWLNGGSCDGCTVAAVASTKPPVEKLIAGLVPGLPRVELIHPLVALESGPAFMENHFMAERNELDAPYVIVWEGSVFDEDLSGDGFFYRLGEEAGSGAPITTTDWLRRLAPGAAAVVAIGSCATWGGIPASHGNQTGSVAVMDFLGQDYRSAFGVPVVNVPGCSPIGDNFMETAAAVLLFLQGMGPLPEFDALGRPAWLFGETVHRHCPRAGYYEEGVFADHHGEKECLVELGCWGPVVQCNIAERGMVNGVGGCMNMGGICIGCTMPAFPDKFSPMFSIAPGSLVSSTTSRVVGGFIRRMRRVTAQDKNLTPRWENRDKPSGWARFQPGPTKSAKLIHKLYRAYQHTKLS